MKWYRLLAIVSIILVTIVILSGCFLFKPFAPTDLTATALSQTSIQLKWSGKGDSFILLRGKSPSELQEVKTISSNPYTDTNLLPNTTYYYEVEAKNGFGVSNPSNMASATTLPYKPEAPVLKIISESTSTISLSWTESSTLVNGFKLYRSNDLNGTFTQIATLDKNASSYVDSNLNSNTTYYYKMKAFNKAGESYFSNMVNAKTKKMTTIPLAPSDLKVISVTSGSITLKWKANSKDQLGFYVYKSNTYSGTYTVVANVSSTRYTDKNLDYATTYYYKVTAYNYVGESKPSNIASGTTIQEIPFNPSELVITKVSTDTISLKWKDNSKNEEGFKLYRSTNSTTGFVQVATPTENATSYTDKNLKSNTAYYYKITAYNSMGESLASNEASTKTKIWIPTAPTDFEITTYSTDSITLKWKNTYEATTVVYRKSISHNTYTENGVTKAKFSETVSSNDFTPIATLSYATATYTDIGLEYNTTYYYKLRSYTKFGWSPFTPISSITTKNVLPKSPTNLILKATSTHNVICITLQWKDNSNNEDGFRIWRKDDQSQAYTLVSTVKANTTTYTDCNLKPHRSYWYMISAYNSIGNSWSNSIEYIPSIALLVNDKNNLNDYDKGFEGVLDELNINYMTIDIEDVVSNPKILSNYKVVISNIMGYGESLKSKFNGIKTAIQNSLNSGTQYIIGSESVSILETLGLATTRIVEWGPGLHDTVAITSLPFSSNITEGVNVLPNQSDYLGHDGNSLSSYFGSGVYWKVTGYNFSFLFFNDYISYPTLFAKGVMQFVQSNDQNWIVSDHEYVLGPTNYELGTGERESGPVQFLVGKSRIMYLSSFWTKNNVTKDGGWIGPEGKTILLNTIKEYLKEEAQGTDPGQVTNLSVSQNGTSTTPTLTWDELSGADRYEIWRKKDNDVFCPMDVVTSTTWTDENTTSNSTYTYMVRGINKDIPGAFSEQVSTTIP